MTNKQLINTTLISLTLFVGGIFLAICFRQLSSSSNLSTQMAIESYDFIWKDSFIHILKNNLLIVSMNIFGFFLFGFPSIILLISNGYFLTTQLFLYVIDGVFPMESFLRHIVPYMLLELSGIIISGGIGLLGFINLKRLIKSENVQIFFNRNMLLASGISVVLTIVAALTEATVLSFHEQLFNLC